MPKTLSTITLGPSFNPGVGPRLLTPARQACLLACSPAQSSSQTTPYNTHIQLPCLVPCALQDGDISDCKSGRRGLHIIRGVGTVRKTDRSLLSLPSWPYSLPPTIAGADGDGADGNPTVS